MAARIRLCPARDACRGVLPALAPGGQCGQRGVNQAGDAGLKLSFPFSVLLSC